MRWFETQRKWSKKNAIRGRIERVAIRCGKQVLNSTVKLVCYGLQDFGPGNTETAYR